MSEGKSASSLPMFVNNPVRCMYVHGVPGTGKTATVLESIKALTAVSERKVKGRKSIAGKPNVPKFKFIEINGLKLSDPYQAYSLIYQELTGNKASSKKACDYLEHYFLKGCKDEFIVLMVDELDVLCTKKQTILYHLFDWPNHQESNLIVIAIANAMDLPERVMKSRIVSRLGVTRSPFHGYTHQELHQIISSRLEGLKCFDEDAIQLVSRKVAAASGDARRALDICRRAVLISENRTEPSGTKVKGKSESNFIVKVKDVQEALQEIFSSIKIIAIQSCSQQEQIFLQSVVQEFRSCGLEEAALSEVCKHHVAQTTFENVYSPSSEELYEIALRLYELRLILLDENTCYSKKKIRLNVSTDDIDFALKSIEG